MESSEISSLTLEGAAAALLIAVAYKIYRLKCNSHSRCCGEHVELEASNPGGQTSV